MPDYARKIDDAWVLINGAFVVADGGSSEILVDANLPGGPTKIVTYDMPYPHGWVELATPSQRAALGIKPISAPDSPAPGLSVGELEIFDNAGSPKYRYATAEIPLAARLDVLLREIDTKRDALQQADFEYDFGELVAIDDFGNELPAGIRRLQMRPEDRANWGDLQAQAMVAGMANQPATLLPMRAEDNFNIQTTAGDVLVVTSAMFARNAGYLFRGGALKSRARQAVEAEDAAAFDAIDIEAGWQG